MRETVYFIHVMQQYNKGKRKNREGKQQYNRV